MTPSSAPNLEIAALDGADIAFEPYRWPFAAEQREQIENYFARLQHERPGVWNGRVLLLRRHQIDSNTLRGSCFETDFASFCAWRAWMFPDAAVANVFAAAALCSADGAYLVGEMAPATANAGSLYFPCGTPEPADLCPGGRLDLDGSVARELFEETGIGAGELAVEPGWIMVRDGCYLALLKRMTSSHSAGDLRARIMGYLAGQDRPEFTDIRILRSPRDFDPAMPRFVVEFLQHVWRE